MTDQALATVQQQDGVQLGSLVVRNSHDVIARATVIANELAKLVKSRGLSKNISGREYVYVDGWETMGAMLGISPREVSVIEHETGDYEAVVELVRTSDGAIVGRGSAIVGADERMWTSRPRYARRSMAITRATGKAYRISFSWIMSLAGYATTPAEEMDGIIEGEFVEKQQKPVTPPIAQPAPSVKPEAKPVRPYDPETLKAGIVQRAKKLGSYTASDKQIGLLASMLDKCFAGEPNSSDLRHAVQEYLTGKKSSKDMPGEYVKVLLDWLDAKEDDGGDYTPSAMAVKEAQAIRRQSLIDAGQGDLFATASSLGGQPA